MRVAVFAQGDKAEAAKAAGADIVGLDDLAERSRPAKSISTLRSRAPTPCAWSASSGQIWAARTDAQPEGRDGTPDVAAAVKNAKAGQVQYRADKAGIVQCTIGRASFSPEQLRDNLAALVDALNKSKPSSSKGVYLRKVSVSSTMGPGIRVDLSSIIGGAAQHQ